jgi:hypothetical protein
MKNKLPFVVDWVEYKGETKFALWNYEASQKAKKPMYDLAYCATQGLQGNIEKTVQFDKNKFKPSKLGMDFKSN